MQFSITAKSFGYVLEFSDQLEGTILAANSTKLKIACLKKCAQVSASEVSRAFKVIILPYNFLD